MSGLNRISINYLLSIFVQIPRIPIAAAANSPKYATNIIELGCIFTAISMSVRLCRESVISCHISAAKLSAGRTAKTGLINTGKLSTYQTILETLHEVFDLLTRERNSI